MVFNGSIATNITTVTWLVNTVAQHINKASLTDTTLNDIWDEINTQ